MPRRPPIDQRDHTSRWLRLRAASFIRLDPKVGGAHERLVKRLSQGDDAHGIPHAVKKSVLRQDYGDIWSSIHQKDGERH
jgi:hypothetical protein